MNTIELIKYEEGFKDKPYLDTLGIPTFGYGFTYITKEESEVILKGRIFEIESQLTQTYTWFNDLTQSRKDILISMVYQLGFNGFSKFKDMIQALELEDYDLAAEAMIDSLWYKQTPNRVKRASELIRNG